MDNALTRPEQNGPRLLVSGLGLDKAHLGLASRCGDGLGIGCVVLLALHEGADVLRRDQLNLMADASQLACPEMGTAAGLQDDERRWHIRHEPEELQPR